MNSRNGETSRRGGINITRRSTLALLAGAATLPLVSGVLPALAADEQVLRIAHPRLQNDWSPIRGGGPHYRLTWIWWASPLYYDDAGTIHPYVFSRWEGNADSTLWNFEIDPKATFSDGSPITAADVKASWELSSMPATKNQRVDQVLSTVNGFAEISGGQATELSGVKATGDRTLEVSLGSSDPIFFAKLANHLVPIVKGEQARGADGNEVMDWWSPDGGVVVSGPFKPVTMDLDSGNLVFERNEHFFGPKPILDRIEIQTVEDTPTAVALLKQGKVDMHTLISTPTLIDELGADFLAGAPAPEGDHFWFNVSKAPTDDENVRRALMMAVDTEELVKLTFPNGPGTHATQILNAVPGVDPNFKTIGFDPEQAKKLLAASKYQNAASLPAINIVGVSTPAQEVAAQYIAEQWRKILGIDSVGMKSQIDSFGGPDQASVQVFRDNVGTRIADPVAFLRGVFYSQSSNAKNKLGNYKDAEVDDLLDKASIEPLDSPKRIEMAQAAQQKAYDQAVVLPWVNRNMPKMAMPWVKDIAKNMDWQVFEPWKLRIERS